MQTLLLVGSKTKVRDSLPYSDNHLYHAIKLKKKWLKAHYKYHEKATAAASNAIKPFVDFIVSSIGDAAVETSDESEVAVAGAGEAVGMGETVGASVRYGLTQLSSYIINPFHFIPNEFVGPRTAPDAKGGSVLGGVVSRFVVNVRFHQLVFGAHLQTLLRAANSNAGRAFAPKILKVAHHDQLVPC